MKNQALQNLNRAERTKRLWDPHDIGGVTSINQLQFRDILQQCLKLNEQTAWTEFVRRTQSLIAAVIIKRVRNLTGSASTSLIDDLVQETYLKLCANDFKALREFICEHENAIYGFLKVVAANVASDHFRSSLCQKRGNGRDEQYLEEANLIPAEIHGGFRNVERATLLNEIEKCLERNAAGPTFSRDYMIFRLYYREGLTAKAIAKIPFIGLTVKGVESTLFRLTRLIKSKLMTLPDLGAGTLPKAD